MKEKSKYISFIQFYISLHNKGWKRLSYFFYWVNRFLFSCDIPPQVKIGKNLQLPHFGLGVVIHPCTIIGNNVKIYQNITIGARNGNWHTVIHDNVLIGAGAVILGSINLGNNCKIGANAVVLEDVPENTTAIGIPAKPLIK